MSYKTSYMHSVLKFQLIDFILKPIILKSNPFLKFNLMKSSLHANLNDVASFNRDSIVISPERKTLEIMGSSRNLALKSKACLQKCKHFKLHINK